VFAQSMLGRRTQRLEEETRVFVVGQRLVVCCSSFRWVNRCCFSISLGVWKGLHKVSLGPAMPDPSTPCGRTTLETALWRPSFTPLDTPRRTLTFISTVERCGDVVRIVQHVADDAAVRPRRPSVDAAIHKVRRFVQIDPDAVEMNFFLEFLLREFQVKVDDES
jgi:hypothetical protein